MHIQYVSVVRMYQSMSLIWNIEYDDRVFSSLVLAKSIGALQRCAGAQLHWA